MNTSRDFTHALGVYLTNCRADDLSPATITNYENHLTAYADFCAGSGLDLTDSASVMAWKLALHDAGLKNSSIAVYMRDVRLFFSWASSSPLCDIDAQPVSDGMIPKVKRQPYDKLMSEDQIVELLRGEKRDGARKTAQWTRNSAMAILFVESAVRVSELCAITPADLDWENGIIYIAHGKGDKSRWVTFPRLAQDAVSAYLDSGLRPADAPMDAPLFGTMSATHPEWHSFTRTQASDLIQRHVKAVTGRDDVRAHALRHASASAMLTLEMPKEQIQSLLGHSAIQTTERYIGMLRPKAAAVAGTDMFADLERRAAVREVV